MQITQLGRTGLRVSRLCLGTMNFGPRTSESDSHQIMDRALADGVNFFDTADIYGTDGSTEEIVGRWLSKGEHRDEVVLATKVYQPMGRGENDRGLSARHIVKACEDSLRRLQTDWIDLYQMHHVDRSTPWEEIWQAMDTLVAQGKVIYVGSSNFAGWHIARAQESAQARHTLGLVSEQSLYNLMDRTVELEVLPACQYYGLGVLVWSPLNRGVLAGILGNATQGRRGGEEAQAILAKNVDRVTAYEGLCAELGAAPAEIGLAWLLHQQAVTATIIGPATIAHLETAERALEKTLDQATLDRLDEIWPGLGPAPEAYAW
jgi:NDP-hexose C3-ketoreductase / dTDP-4-oxo-2-deoxy-alpha-D-pentos-2-ene 2,3-reductase